MRSIWMAKLSFAALVGSTIGGLTMGGCANEREPIYRTQAGIVEKSFFLGPNLEDPRDDPEFRTKSFNIDSAVNTSNFNGTIGGATAVDRVRWEVTEDWLFARRSYQESPGSDKRALPRVEVSPGVWEFPGRPDGTIIAAYKIESHFDVRRDYNSQTGEETNVMVENTSDRPWYLRAEMRVDWSQNKAESTSGADTSWVFGEGSQVTAIQYASTNDNDEDRPLFDVAKGYFDVTNKYQLKPDIMPEFGIAECVITGFFNGATSGDCTPTEVKLRSSYVKLTGNEDFESFEENLAQRDIVGNWGNAGSNYNREYGGAPLTAWDPQYGFTDAKTKTFFAIHNIWEKSHQGFKCSSNSDISGRSKDDGSDAADGTADACTNGKTGYKGSSGSQCDLNAGKCTIPIRDRSVKTIGYWLNIDTPLELLDQVDGSGKVKSVGPIEEMTITWNQFLKVAVATRREVECRRTFTGDRDACHALYFAGTGPEAKEMVAFGGWGVDKTKVLPVDQDRPIITTCHNPVRSYDPSNCGTVGEKIRLGDVRKNYTIYWPYASRAPYGGVASIGGDPLTGEMVGATATIMGRSATFAAAQQRDIIQLAVGDISVDQLVAGGQAERYADLVKSGKIVSSSAKTPAQLEAAVKNIDVDNVKATVSVTAPTLDSLSGEKRQLERAKLRAQDSVMSPRLAKNDERLTALLKQLDNTEYASEITNRGLQQLVAGSKDQSTAAYQAIKTFASQDPSRIQDLYDHYQAYLGSKGVCFLDSSANAGVPGSIYQPSLGPYFEQKYGSRRTDPPFAIPDKPTATELAAAEARLKERGVKIYDDLLREAVKGIGFHEIGHSIGLRHNFASSWDSQNYAPQYWQLRTNEGQATTICTKARTDATDSCLGPRYLDPMTDDEQGVGTESRPGIEYFANTSTMEYQVERFGETVGGGTYDLHAMKTLYGRVLPTFDDRIIPPASQQYFAVKTLSQGIPSELVFDPKKGYGMHYTRAAMTAKVFDAARDCRDATEAEKATAKWRIVHGKVCAPSPQNHLAFEDMKSSEIAFTSGKTVNPIGVNGVRWSGVDENGQTLTRWQFRYGEDYSRGGYIHAKLFDSGADVYETTINVTKRYDLTYPWSYFRRLNKEFAWWSLPNSIAGSTFSRMRAYHWSTTTDIGRSNSADLANDDQDRPAVMASAEMFNFLQRVILTPEPGGYGKTASVRTSPRAGALPILDMTDSTGANAFGSIGVIDGRYVQIDFDSDRGGSWDYQHYPLHVGFDEEKVLALRELVDSRPTLSTVSRENALDGRDPYISFRTDTPHAIDRLVGALMSEDWEALGPSMLAQTSVLQNFNLLDKDPNKLTRPAGAAIIFPNMGYSNELGTGIYGLLFSRYSSDMTLATKMRIRIDGDAGPTVPDSRRVSFNDPVTGQRYIASRFGSETLPKACTQDSDCSGVNAKCVEGTSRYCSIAGVTQGRAVETGIGSRMIQRANDLLTVAYEVKKDVNGNPIFNSYGEPELILDTNGQPKKGTAAAILALQRYIGLLDGMRQVSKILGGGPLGGGGGDGE